MMVVCIISIKHIATKIIIIAEKISIPVIALIPNISKPIPHTTRKVKNTKFKKNVIDTSKCTRFIINL